MEKRTSRLITLVILFGVFVFTAFGLYVKPAKAIEYYGGNYVLLSSYYLAPGQTVEVHGYRFYPQETVTVRFNGSTKSVSADSNGRLMTSFTVPYVPSPSQRTMTATAEGVISRTPRSASLVVRGFDSWLILSSYYLRAGNSLSIHAYGFASGEMIHFYWQGSHLGAVTADGSGHVVKNISVPAGRAGIKEISARGESTGASARTLFYQAP